MPQNAGLKYAGNVREGESRYSIITGLLHLQLIPDRTAVIHSSCFREKENRGERKKKKKRECKDGLVTKSRSLQVITRTCCVAIASIRDRFLECDVSLI